MRHNEPRRRQQVGAAVLHFGRLRFFPAWRRLNNDPQNRFLMPRPRRLPETLIELLNESSRPTYAVDDRQRIVFCNPALAAWLELDPARIIGRFVEYHSEHVVGGDFMSDSSAPLTDLCPPPRALFGEPCAGTISCAIKGGRLAHRHAEFIPLPQMPDARGRTRPGCAVLAILGNQDLAPEDLAASADPSPDELHRTIRRFRRAQAGQYSLESLLGESTAMRKVRAQVAAVAASGANALVIGTPGSGRAHVARAIHYQAAAEAVSRLVPLDGRFLTDDLLRRALDAVRSPGSDPKQRPTLLVENLDCLSPVHQAQLSDMIGREAFRARILATCQTAASFAADGMASHIQTNAGTPSLTGCTPGLHPAIEPSLFHMVSTISIQLPRLRDRLEDLPIITQCFLEACNRDSGKQVGSLRADVLDQLALYAWPDELDELREVIAAAHEACRSHEITPTDLPAVVHHASHSAARRRTAVQCIVLDELLGRIEREAIERALAQAEGNKTEAAELLGMTRPRLYRRLIQLGLVSESKNVEDQVPEFIEQPPGEDTP